MPRWTPTPEWKGQPVVIIGGGPSLLNFNFPLWLTGRNTIGCNDAYRLGPSIVKICLFGDNSFFERDEEGLEKFPNRVVSMAPSLLASPLPWLLTLDRIRDGLHTGHKLGWNHSTGAAAVNLALCLGASRIFLLGFDMIHVKGADHWHTFNKERIQEASYLRFLRGFSNVHRDLQRKFPAVQVVNVTDGTSRLPYFMKLSFEGFYNFLSIQYRGQGPFASKEADARMTSV